MKYEYYKELNSDCLWRSNGHKDGESRTSIWHSIEGCWVQGTVVFYRSVFPICDKLTKRQVKRLFPKAIL